MILSSHTYYLNLAKLVSLLNTDHNIKINTILSNLRDFQAILHWLWENKSPQGDCPTLSYQTKIWWVIIINYRKMVLDQVARNQPRNDIGGMIWYDCIGSIIEQ